MRKALKDALARAASAARRPNESWQMFREGVSELHMILQHLTELVGDLEAYLARYDAPGEAASAAFDKLKPRRAAASKRAPATRKKARRA